MGTQTTLARAMRTSTRTMVTRPASKAVPTSANVNAERTKRTISQTRPTATTTVTTVQSQSNQASANRVGEDRDIWRAVAGRPERHRTASDAVVHATNRERRRIVSTQERGADACACCSNRNLSDHATRGLKRTWS